MKRVDTPHGRYYEMAGGKLPSVTTLLNLLAKPALIPWAAGVERDAWREAVLRALKKNVTPASAVTLAALIEAEVGPTKAYLKEVKDAQNIGTAVHERIDWELRGELGKIRPQTPPALDHPKSIEAFENWLDWRVATQLKVVETELKVAAPKLGFAGTLDTLCLLGGSTTEHTVIDYKTGAAIYYESLLQNGMYQLALLEMGIWVTGGLIVRLPKVPDDPTFEVVMVPPVRVMKAGIKGLLSINKAVDGLKRSLPMRRKVA